MDPLKYYINVPIPFITTFVTNVLYMFIQTCAETIEFILTFMPQNLFQLEYDKYTSGITILICLYLDMSWLYKLLKTQKMFDAGSLLNFLSVLIPITKEITNDFKVSFKKEGNKIIRLFLIPPTIFFNTLYASLYYTQYYLLHETIVEERLEKIFISFFKAQFSEFGKTINSKGGEEGLIELLDNDINNGFDTFLFLFISFLSNISQASVVKMSPLGVYIILVMLKLIFDTLRHVFYAKRNQLNLQAYKNYDFNMKNNNLIPKIVFLSDSLFCYAIKRKLPFQQIERRFSTPFE